MQFFFKVLLSILAFLSHAYGCAGKEAEAHRFFNPQQVLCNPNTTEACNRLLVIEQQKNVIESLCHSSDKTINNAMHLSLANDIVEWAFSPEHTATFLAMHTEPVQYPMLQFLYTALWSILSEKGWQDWHASCIELLKQDHKKGKSVVYIGGGCDIDQLIRNGIYNVTIIDPILPSQHRYYPKNYEFLVKGSGPDNGLSDLIRYEDIYMKRTSVHLGRGYISTKLPSGQIRCIAESTTIWTVYNHKDIEVGRIVFERRYAQQQDFTIDQKRSFLLSWNELYFVINGSWHINPKLFDKDLVLFIKQLRKPVSHDRLLQMVVAEELNQRAFAFIGLGSSVT